MDIMRNLDIMRNVVHFMDAKQYLFFASVSRTWNKAWGGRPAITSYATSDISVSQLVHSFKCGLPRTNQICAAIARVGRTDLLQCALQHGYPWTGIASKSAAFAGHLHVLKWAQKKRLAWDEDVCARSAEGGHLEVLRWARQNGCGWGSSTCGAAAHGGHLEVLQYARQHGCPLARRSLAISIS